MLNVTLTGTSGMMPLKNRWLSSCLLNTNGHSVLVDCGEGTQIAMKCAGLRFKPVDVICITHFHADHISGLPGFLLTLCSEGRTEPVTVIGPAGLARVVRALCTIAPNLTYELRCVEYNGFAFRTDELKITPFPVRHGVPCLGYRFDMDRAGKFDPERAKQNNVPMKIWSTLQKKGAAEFEGRLYTPDMVMGPPRKGLRVTYTTDTRPTDSIAENAQGADLFICEGMFSDPEKLPRAVETKHMIFSEAAAIAKKAGVRRLWLTHYSPSLSEPEEGLSAATDIFPDAECGFDGKTIDLLFDES
ncbi:MAG: ribonuclease Z [Clostridia bacterium]|nr:ribonuclease Z [Clostridia bacterium]